MKSEQGSLPALADEKSIKEFSSWLLELAGSLQATLHQLSAVDKLFTGSGYGVLMEVYGLRTRAYILLNDSANHIVNSLDFSQGDLLLLFDRVSRVVPAVSSLKIASSIVLSVATFTVSLGEDRSKIVNFLFRSFCDDLAEWEASLN